MPSPVGGLGLAPRKKSQFCVKNYAILSKFLVLLSYITTESGGLSPLHPPPCSDAYPFVNASSLFFAFRHLRGLNNAATKMPYIILLSSVM